MNPEDTSPTVELPSPKASPIKAPTIELSSPTTNHLQSPKSETQKVNPQKVSPLKRSLTSYNSKQVRQIGPNGRCIFTTAYELTGPLVGRGSYGAVYPVRLVGGSPDSSPDLVIKLVCIHWDDICDIRRVLREAMVLLAATQHPSGLVQLYDAFWCQTRNHVQLALVMPRYDYSLYDVISCSEPNSEPIIKHLMWQVTCAIADCHEAELLYSDLKSSNVLVNKDGIIALADFSLTVGFPMPASEVRKPRMSRYYRALEITLQRRFGLRADVWSLGCLFIEMLQLLHPQKNRRVFAIVSPDDSLEGQLDAIIRMIGAPTQESPAYKWLMQIDPDLAARALQESRAPELPPLVASSKGAEELIRSMLELDPGARISILGVMESTYFNEERVRRPWTQRLPGVDLRAADRITCRATAAQEFARVVSEIQKTTSGPSVQDSQGPPAKHPYVYDSISGGIAPAPAPTGAAGSAP
jgi:serine/threonine protein kinase